MSTKDSVIKKLQTKATTPKKKFKRYNVSICASSNALIDRLKLEIEAETNICISKSKIVEWCLEDYDEQRTAAGK